MALPPTTALPTTRSGRTFFVALTLLGIAALTQLLVLAGYLIGGGAARRTVAVASSTPAPVVGPAPTPVPSTTTPSPGGTVATPLPAAVAQGTPPPAVFARPTPAPAPRLQNATDLLEQARQLRARGDMNSALARLREAQVNEGDNAQIIAEMALTYEAMQMPERAFEQWQRVANLGEGVGALYALARLKLENVPAKPAAAETAAGGTVNSEDGSFQEGGDAVLKLTDVRMETIPDPAMEQKIALKIVVKNRPGTAIDPTKVRILTYFYDLLDGKDAVLTDAQTAFAWLTPGKIDWVNDKSEVLETTYLRPKAAPTPQPTPTPEASPKKATRRGKSGAAEATPAPTPTPTPAPVRTYLGYTVRLYYDRQLQDVKADPPRLLQQFPPQTTLPAE